MHVVFAVLIFIAMVVIAAVVVGGWILVTLFRLIARAVSPAPVSMAPMPARPAVVRCGRPQCMEDNPGGARFCRRCGQALRGARAPVLRRVA